MRRLAPPKVSSIHHKCGKENSMKIATIYLSEILSWNWVHYYFSHTAGIIINGEIKSLPLIQNFQKSSYFKVTHGMNKNLV